MALRRSAILTATAFVLCALLVLAGRRDEGRMDFSSIIQVWGDVSRDLDQFGLQVTRLSAPEEAAFGDQLLRREVRSLPQDELTDFWAPYVSAVGARVAAHVRRKGMPYRFHVIRDAYPNAFALPGGHVFITLPMVESLQTEAGLAVILGHEIAHVDLRHCIAHYQYAVKLGKLGAGPLGQTVDLARSALVLSYMKNDELDADAEGLRLAAAAGYEPRVAAPMFRQFAFLDEGPSSTKPRTPAGELARASVAGFSLYFRSHPMFAERIHALDRLAERIHRKAPQQQFKIGREEYWKLLRAARHL